MAQYPPRTTPETLSSMKQPFRFKRLPREQQSDNEQQTQHRRKRARKDPGESRQPFGVPLVLPPDSAFRESLFDALADEEGAAYWESVYGQPIHIYSRYRLCRTSRHGPPAPNSSSGSVFEHMDDDAYVAHVRARIWERSQGRLEAERQRLVQLRREQRLHQRQRAAPKKDNAGAYEQQSEAPVKTSASELDTGIAGESNASGRCLAEWQTYVRGWEALTQMAEAASTQGSSSVANGQSFQRYPRIPWPVATGRSHDIGQSTVESFLRTSATLVSDGAGFDEHGALLDLVKTERSRWHPDRITRRLTVLVENGLSEDTMRTVTTVFQIIDRFWKALGRK